MELSFRQFLAMAVIFCTQSVLAAPKGEVKDFTVKTVYQCHTNGVVVRHGAKAISGPKSYDVKFVAQPGQNQSLTFGEREYKIWPQVTNSTFNKSISVFVRDDSGKFNIAQEIMLGDAQKTKTTIALTVKEGTNQERPVTCGIEMEWVKKNVQSVAAK
jgi:uncharacterized beta-barrel protein YwiB (DUF1934 family)